jgi:hypothetical protein
VTVLCASRPRHPYIDKLAMRGVLAQIDLDDATSFADDNAATVRAFWEQVAPRWDWMRISSPRRWSAPAATWSTPRCCAGS